MFNVTSCCSTAPPLVRWGSFLFEPVIADSVISKFLHLQTGKSCGHDLITNELLRMAGSSISGPLADLFNWSLSDGIFPDMWKEAVISPHLKEGKDATQPTSYRPFSVLSCVAKVLERLVYDQLITFCLDNEIFQSSSFASCRVAPRICSYSQSWKASMQRWIVVAIFMQCSSMEPKHLIELTTLYFCKFYTALVCRVWSLLGSIVVFPGGEFGPGLQGLYLLHPQSQLVCRKAPSWGRYFSSSTLKISLK